VIEQKNAASLEGVEWPLAGYAPGGYTGVCGSCSEHMFGVSKYAAQCLACAIKTSKKSADKLADRVIEAEQSLRHESAAMAQLIEKAEFDLLDKFAAAALTGLIAQTDRSMPSDVFARQAYQTATSMMVERAKQRQKVGAWNCDPNAERDAIELMTECATTFRNYEALHRAKDTADGAAKASRNAVIAEKIEALLRRINAS